MSAAISEHLALTIADLYAQPPLIPLWPELGRGVLGLSESTTYQYANEGRLPVELVRVGRRRYARTQDVLAWLHLQPNGDGAGWSEPTPPVENALDPHQVQLAEGDARGGQTPNAAGKRNASHGQGTAPSRRSGTPLSLR